LTFCYENEGTVSEEPREPSIVTFALSRSFLSLLGLGGFGVQDIK